MKTMQNLLDILLHWLFNNKPYTLMTQNPANIISNPHITATQNCVDKILIIILFLAVIQDLVKTIAVNWNADEFRLQTMVMVTHMRKMLYHFNFHSIYMLELLFLLDFIRFSK